MKNYVNFLFPSTLSDADYNEIKNNSKAKLSILKSLYLYLKSIGINLNKYKIINYIYYRDKCYASEEEENNFKDYTEKKIDQFLKKCGMESYDNIIMKCINK